MDKPSTPNLDKLRAYPYALEFERIIEFLRNWLAVPDARRVIDADSLLLYTYLGIDSVALAAEQEALQRYNEWRVRDHDANPPLHWQEIASVLRKAGFEQSTRGDSVWTSWPRGFSVGTLGRDTVRISAHVPVNGWDSHRYDVAAEQEMCRQIDAVLTAKGYDTKIHPTDETVLYVTRKHVEVPDELE